MDKLDKKIKELQAENNRKLIFSAIRMTQSVYSELVYEKGLCWITNNMSLNDDGVVYAIAKCPLFWAWWRNQWELRDANYVYLTNLAKQKLPFDMEATVLAVELYNDTHDLKNIKLIPNRFVIEEIGKALRELTAQETERLKQLLNGK